VTVTHWRWHFPSLSPPPNLSSSESLSRIGASSFHLLVSPSLWRGQHVCQPRQRSLSNINRDSNTRDQGLMIGSCDGTWVTWCLSRSWHIWYLSRSWHIWYLSRSWHIWYLSRSWHIWYLSHSWHIWYDLSRSWHIWYLSRSWHIWYLSRSAHISTSCTAGKEIKNLMRIESTGQGQSEVMSWTDEKPLFLPRIAMILCIWHDKCLLNCLYQKWNKTEWTSVPQGSGAVKKVFRRDFVFRFQFSPMHRYASRDDHTSPPCSAVRGFLQGSRWSSVFGIRNIYSTVCTKSGVKPTEPVSPRFSVAPFSPIIEEKQKIVHFEASLFTSPVREKECACGWSWTDQSRATRDVPTATCQPRAGRRAPRPSRASCLAGRTRRVTSPSRCPQSRPRQPCEDLRPPLCIARCGHLQCCIPRALCALVRRCNSCLFAPCVLAELSGMTSVVWRVESAGREGYNTLPCCDTIPLACYALLRLEMLVDYGLVLCIRYIFFGNLVQPVPEKMRLELFGEYHC